MEQIADWVAPVATTIAAIMVAANLGSRITGFGFIAFAVGSVGWIAIGVATGQANLVWQNVVLLAVNALGVWRWLGLRARYDRGSAVATRDGAAAATAAPPGDAAVPDAADGTPIRITQLLGASVADRDGSAAGAVAEVMVAAAEGRIIYLALSVGGVAGIGERMFAVPWSCFVVDPVAGTLSLRLAKADFDGHASFNKDAWPSIADARLVAC